MVILKTSPTGIDFYIQNLQKKIHDQLVGPDFLNLTDSDKYIGYGRAYRNRLPEGGYIAENYEGAGEYKEIYWNDNLSILSFFGLSNPPIKKEVTNQTEIHLVFFANLEKLAIKDSDGNLIVHRADEELRSMVQTIIGRNSFGFRYDSTELWLENVLKEYPGSRREDRLKFVDMHPIHCFRINLKLFYNPTKNC